MPITNKGQGHLLEIHLELNREDSGTIIYQSRIERIEKLSDKGLQGIREKHEVDGWKVQNWTVSEQLLFDEGRSAASQAISDDANPYAEDSLKHHEWQKGEG